MGFLSGLVYKNCFRPKPQLRLAASVGAAPVLGSMLIKSIGLRIYFGYPLQMVALRVPLYTSRATEAHPRPPMTRMMFHTEGPTRFTMASTRMMPGKDWKVSQARLIQDSHFPPLYPAKRPKGTPSTAPRAAEANPTSREVRPP